MAAGWDGNRRLNRKQNKMPSRMADTNTFRSRALAVAVMLHARSLASWTSVDAPDCAPLNSSVAASVQLLPHVRSIRMRSARRSSVMRLTSMFLADFEKLAVLRAGAIRLIT